MRDALPHPTWQELAEQLHPQRTLRASNLTQVELHCCRTTSCPAASWRWQTPMRSISGPSLSPTISSPARCWRLLRISLVCKRVCFLTWAPSGAHRPPPQATPAGWRRAASHAVEGDLFEHAASHVETELAARAEVAGRARRQAMRPRETSGPLPQATRRHEMCARAELTG